MTMTTTPVIVQPPKDVRQKYSDTMVSQCAQGFYDALAYYDAYRLIFNTMYSAKVLDSQEMEDQAVKEREALEATVGKLYDALESSCGAYVQNRWLDNRWG